MVPQCIFVMGVAGSGKSTIGEEIAKKLGAQFQDADEYHPKANQDKMAKGIALTDDDRKPWLMDIAKLASDSTSRIVIACSALKQSYRSLLTIRLDTNDYVFLCLKVSREVLEKRITQRKGHFVHSDLLDSQLATLELPENEKNCYIIDADKPLDVILKDCMAILESKNQA